MGNRTVNPEGLWSPLCIVTVRSLKHICHLCYDDWSHGYYHGIKPCIAFSLNMQVHSQGVVELSTHVYPQTLEKSEGDNN